MSDVEQFSSLVADIYYTALDPKTWPRVLEKVCEIVGGCASNVFSQDTLCDLAQVHYSWGDNPRYVQLYLDKYITILSVLPRHRFRRSRTRRRAVGHHSV